MNMMKEWKRVRELLIFFMKENKEEFVILLEEDKWRGCLACLADIFQHLNVVNSSLQEPSENIVALTDKLSTLQSKLSVWLSNSEEGR